MRSFSDLSDLKYSHLNGGGMVVTHAVNSVTVKVIACMCEDDPSWIDTYTLIVAGDFPTRTKVFRHGDQCTLYDWLQGLGYVACMDVANALCKGRWPT